MVFAASCKVHPSPKLTVEDDCGPTMTESPAANCIEDWAGTEPPTRLTKTLPATLCNTPVAPDEA